MYLTAHIRLTQMYAHVAHLVEKEALGRQELLQALSFTLMKRICNLQRIIVGAAKTLLENQHLALVDLLSGLM